MTPLPASHETLVSYVSLLFKQNLQGSTIKVYLSAIRHEHIRKDYPSPLDGGRLALVLRAAVAMSDSPNRKLPIKYTLLRLICGEASKRFDGTMLRAAMCLAYFGCLRSGELCLPDNTDFDPEINLAVRNVIFNDAENYFVLFLSRSKTDRKNEGVSINVGCSNSDTCAYCYMKCYLDTRILAHPLDPLFVDPYGNVLSKSNFVSSVRMLLSMCGKNPSLYSGHSFRAGAATDASDKEFHSHDIKLLGRWASNAFNIYLRNPKKTSKFAKKLAIDG